MKRVSALLLALSSLSSVAAPLSMNEAWEDFSNPDIMSYFFTPKFKALPLKAEINPTTKYWSGDYWSLKRGSINYRWNAKNKMGFNLNSPSKERAMKMTIPELAELAPTEKYDLFVGRYDYPLRNEVYKIADPEAQIWEGICHGWAPATMNHLEPRPKVMRNPDGIDIPFGSSDIKALISYYYAYGFQVANTKQMGHRCFKSSFSDLDKDCINDLNAGAFHIVMANRIGIEGIGLIVDLERYKEVWNHPITKYDARIVAETGPEQGNAYGTVKVYRMKTTITYLDENGNDWQVIHGTAKQFYGTANYEYKIEVDSKGNIIGGDWISKARPDFLWMKSRPLKFQGNLSRLGELLED